MCKELPLTKVSKTTATATSLTTTTTTAQTSPTQTRHSTTQTPSVAVHAQSHVHRHHHQGRCKYPRRHLHSPISIHHSVIINLPFSASAMINRAWVTLLITIISNRQKKKRKKCNKQQNWNKKDVYVKQYHRVVEYCFCSLLHRFVPFSFARQLIQRCHKILRSASNACSS